jgi:osmotically-inducible protein OsmY
MDDKTLHHAAAEELEWAPHLDASHIQVTVHDGVVRLSGHVGTLAEKKAANRSVWHLQGVVGVHDEIEVRPVEAERHSDEELVRRAKQVLLWDSMVPGADIHVNAENGIVTLTGTLDLPYQSVEAEERVQQLAGVVRINNQIAVRPSSSIAAGLGDKVRRALARHSDLDASRIVVEVHGNHVRLLGTVPSYIQRRIAENAAWAAPGVSEVVDLMRVGH